METNNNIGNNQIEVKVCAVNQFGGNTNCVTKTKSFEITETPANTYCGDGTCQSNEDKARCPTDCDIINPIPPKPIPPKPDTCGAWISMPSFLGGGTILPDIGCELNNLFKPLIWIFALIGGLLAGLFGFKTTENLVKNKKEKWISIVAGVAIAIAIFSLIFIFFWWGIVTLILLGIIKSVMKGVVL